MSKKNATHLFIQPWREYHHSESFWSAWAALFLMSLDKANVEKTLPIYRLDLDIEFRRSEKLILGNRSLEDIVVEGSLRGRPFMASGWPNMYDLLKPDIVAWNGKGRRVWIIETKTIGESVVRNVELYGRLRDYLRDLKPAWDARLIYLISQGHEHKGDWKILQEKDSKAEFLLWEDLFRAAEGTPFASAVCDNLEEYTTQPTRVME